ncbi:uncharacterized protein isoform X1 [Takifugu rubripes]|uniref:uncharacterized protein isoform X1 n=1 Tax=Takifugu rubripes TaxID=31033 RepID=UPI001145CA8B|nr:uncharacterized protein LOC105416407 isoform X1 [Takifugu rubripes]
MTWRNRIHLFVCVLLCMIYPSEEKCKDYFSQPEFNSTMNFLLVIPKDPKDTLKCTAEKGCLNNETFFCDILYGCFNLQQAVNASKECQSKTFRNMPRFHLTCLFAHEFNVTTQACEYVTTCEMYPAKPIAVHTTTAATSATSIATASTISTATSTTATPESTDPETATATANQPTKVAMNKQVGSNDEMLKTLLKISVTLNIIVPLIVWLYMRRPGLPSCPQTRTAGEAEPENQEPLRYREDFTETPSSVHVQDNSGWT